MSLSQMFDFPLFSYLPALITIFPLLVHFLIIKCNKHHLHTNPYPIFGHIPQFLNNRHRALDWFTQLLSETKTNTLVFHSLGDRGVITANPANIEHMLKSDFDNFPKGPRVRFTVRDFLGNGIFNSDGHQWKAQRKTASFEFNTKSLRNFVVESVQHEITTRLIPLLEKYSTNEQMFDIQDVLERFAFDNVCKVAFNVDPSCLTDGDNTVTSTFADAFRDAAEYSAGRFWYVIPGFWRVKRFFNIGSERRLKESVGIVHDFAANIIRSRMKELKLSSNYQAYDLLSRFVATEDYSEEFLRDIVISFLLAGRETTSSALSWFFWIVSSRPDVQSRILEEIERIRGQTGNKNSIMFGFDELREMHYLHAAITESMRLYPPVPTNMLLCMKNTVLPDGTRMEKGDYISYNSYAMGRMEKVWGNDCKEYRPERWLDEDGKFRPESPFKFLAFHAGPRLCLGKEMAYIQMKSIVACLFDKFVVEIVGKEEVPKQSLSLTLRIKGGLLTSVKYRRGEN